jgi:hypothetical protein
VIGLNADRHGSLFMSLAYVLGISFYSVFVHLHLLLLTIFGGLWTGLMYLLRKQKWGSILGHRFVAPTLLCIMTITLYLTLGKVIGVAEWLVWPRFYNPSQIWIIAILATVGTVFYIVKGKIQNNDILKLTIAAMLWFYWMHMINFIFNLPVINFT